MRILITGSLGLVGSEAVKYYLKRGWEVVGIDNNMRRHFFGPEGCGKKNLIKHERMTWMDMDISRVADVLETTKIDAIIHTAGQPSHDWASKNPLLDFEVNAVGTLIILQAARKYAPEAPFVYLSTNKVYGDNPNKIKLKEDMSRFEAIGYENGIDETMSVDHCTHSLFGVSKLSGDLLAQEYARYFGMKTGIFRLGCITGKQHAGVELHGFLAYLAKCKKEKKTYRIYGYKGKQVRDNIHAWDLVNAIDHFIRKPRPGEVYNMGGGTNSNISVLEAIDRFGLTDIEYVDEARKGDHKWYVSNVSKFVKHYPEWCYHHDMEDILEDLISA